MIPTRHNNLHTTVLNEYVTGPAKIKHVNAKIKHVNAKIKHMNAKIKHVNVKNR